MHDKAERRPGKAPDGDTFTVIAILICAFAIWVAKLIAGQPAWDAYFIVQLCLGVPRVYAGIREHRRSDLVMGVLFCLLAVVCVVLSIRRLFD